MEERKRDWAPEKHKEAKKTPKEAEQEQDFSKLPRCPEE